MGIAPMANTTSTTRNNSPARFLFPLPLFFGGLELLSVFCASSFAMFLAFLAVSVLRRHSGLLQFFRRRTVGRQYLRAQLLQQIQQGLPFRIAEIPQPVRDAPKMQRRYFIQQRFALLGNPRKARAPVA